MATLGDRVQARLGSQLRDGETVLDAVQAQRPGVQATLGRFWAGMTPAVAGVLVAQSSLAAGVPLGVVLGVLGILVGVALMVRALVVGRPEAARARFPRNVIVAVTDHRLWICSFYGGLVATPRKLLLDVPLDQILAIRPRPPRGVRLELADGSELAWDHLPKSATEGAQLVQYLRSVVAQD